MAAGVAAVFNKEDSHAGLSMMVNRLLAGTAQAG
jgi:L-fucose isomerase-like protein